MDKNKPDIQGFLLDTTAIIDFLRGQEHVVALLDVLKEKAPLASCPITIAEVFAGTKEKDMEKVEEFLSALRFYPITYAASRLGGFWRYTYARKGVILSLSDTLIAAVAKEHGLALVTANEKHFPMEGLNIIAH